MDDATLQATQFTAAMARLRRELLDELEERDLELHQSRLRSERSAGLFVFWIAERQPARSQEPVRSAVVWASGMIATALQLTLALSTARDFVRDPMSNEQQGPKASRSLTM